MNFSRAQTYIIRRLETELSPLLSYHGPHHTRDVCHAVREIAAGEGVSGKDLMLLETAALYHDAGFLITYQDHEKAGCKIVREQLCQFGYSDHDIEQICGMIMATKIPQSPKTHLEEIICDADLYYLGTQDFYPIGSTLYQEFKAYGIINDELEWNQLQLKFLSAHRYFTKTARKHRNKRKVRHLEEVKELVESAA
ncbi:MAG: HD domain-containing protein [Bacteroidota bacterium]